MNDKVNERMCAVCRKMFNKNKLLRIAKINDSTIIDKNYKSGGRGLYICSIDCFKKATENKKVSRAIKFFIDESLFDEAREIINGKG